ncbi:MAG: dicarboxylate/amino acid:cation symporter [Halanaeroarchaeum sp.]
MHRSTIGRLWSRYRSVQIVYRLAVAFAIGALVGLTVGERATALRPLGDLFLRLLGMLVVPLVVFTILTGMERLSPAKLGRIGGSVVLAYAVTTFVAGAIGLTLANLLNPGVGVTFTGGEAVSAETPRLESVLLGIVPENVFGAMARGDIIAIIFFVVVFGLGLTIARETSEDARVTDGIDTLFAISEAATQALFKAVWGVMEYGVLGVFALVAASVGTNGVGGILSLGSLVAVVALAVVVHMSVVYLGVITMGVLGESPVAFLAGARDAMVTAFSIRSSSGTLPVTMTDAEEHLRIDESVYGFALPLGSTINMDGAAIRQGVTAVFAANILGVQLGIGEQVVALLTVVLVSVGTAGVPGAGLIMLTIVLQTLGLPLEVVGFVAAVDPILGRIATTNNVTGDLAVSALVAKYNDAIDLEGGVWTGGGRNSTPSAADE